MQTRRFVLLVALTLLYARSADAQFNAPSKPAPGENFHVELGLMWWKPTPTLTLSTEGLAAAGVDTVDFVKEFGLPDDHKFREFRATVKLAQKHKLRYSSVSLDYNQDATLQRTITFNGQTFPVSIAANA